ncbi:hypothetical protein NX014_14230 [Vibrio vulnificus]|uniref:hypothetical protein n=1 Tax=Vibrio TaxID=662 RepID=UPI0011210E58|nr:MULTISPECIES: hypothetical protein [Vibrio]EHW0695246.1 hypothetical protein [Vibrio parahaemolyticus]EIU6799565.1 hypothetical protein [Vibrio parahaemolyticus]KAB5596823.1 hypothetical protein F0578_24825 [Vibrio parahaemolyticus]MDT8825434.1 hypothetical protein [Vibrio vulnificus]TOG77334.1 hypothetical protein CGI94_17580 [Vibrio parahaemolyticus]
MDLGEGYVACICEGSAEQAIMDTLLESDMLIFNQDQLLEGEIIRTRSAKQFESKYLRKGFNKTITILRVLDSRNESFKLSNAYKDKISVIDIITAPEIEMLIIISEGKYKEFKKSKKKPSDFCKMDLKIKNVKSYDFVKDYFENIEKLINSISEYKRLSKINKNENTLFDLLK